MAGQRHWAARACSAQTGEGLLGGYAWDVPPPPQGGPKTPEELGMRDGGNHILIDNLIVHWLD